MESMHQGLQRGFMDRTITASSTYTPSYITNNDQQQVLPTLLEQLKTCQSFDFSIAFITEQGLAMLKTSLNELHLRGVKGRIITSTYLSFNQPNVFREFERASGLAAGAARRTRSGRWRRRVRTACKRGTPRT